MIYACLWNEFFSDLLCGIHFKDFSKNRIWSWVVGSKYRVCNYGGKETMINCHEFDSLINKSASVYCVNTKV